MWARALTPGRSKEGSNDYSVGTLELGSVMRTSGRHFLKPLDSSTDSRPQAFIISGADNHLTSK
jgi:hypothetical protein